MTGPVYGVFDQTPVIRTSQGVLSASAYGAFSALAPGTWMEIYGTNLANVALQNWAAADFNGNTAPTALGGTTVTIGGQPAFIDYVSPGQVNAQVPSNISTGPQQVIVQTPGGTSLAYSITVNTTEPGLLAPAVFDLCRPAICRRALYQRNNLCPAYRRGLRHRRCTCEARPDHRLLRRWFWDRNARQSRRPDRYRGQPAQRKLADFLQRYARDGFIRRLGQRLPGTLPI